MVLEKYKWQYFGTIQLCRWNKRRIENVPQIACMSNEDDGLNHNRAQRRAENQGGTPRDLGLVTLHLTLSVNKY